MKAVFILAAAAGLQSITLAQSAWGACEAEVMQFDPVSLPVLEAVALRDTEMAGHSPTIRIDARVYPQGGQLVLSGSVQITEDRGDYTSFVGTFQRYVAPTALKSPECEFLRSSTESGKVNAKARARDFNWTRYEGEGVISRAYCRADSRGDDRGKIGCYIYMDPVTVQFKQRSTAPQVVASGTVQTGGSIAVANPDSVDVSWNSDYERYEISIPGESYYLWDYAALVTPIIGPEPVVATVTSADGRLLVQFTTTDGFRTRSAFHFAVLRGEF